MKKLLFALAAVGILGLSAPQAANADADKTFQVKCVGSDLGAEVVLIRVISDAPGAVALGVDLCLSFNGHPAGVSFYEGS